MLCWLIANWPEEQGFGKVSWFLFLFLCDELAEMAQKWASKALPRKGRGRGESVKVVSELFPALLVRCVDWDCSELGILDSRKPELPESGQCPVDCVEVAWLTPSSPRQANAAELLGSKSWWWWWCAFLFQLLSAPSAG